MRRYLFFSVISLSFFFPSHLNGSEDSLACPSRGPCPAIPVKPVCGTDLRTYGNMCMLKQERCNGKDVKLAYKGVCKSCEEDIKGVISLVMKSFFDGKRNGRKGRRRGSGPACKKPESGIISRGDELRCLQWKFTGADANSDGILTGRELFPTLRVLRRRFGDKRCLRRLIRYCDQNKDRSVTPKEWISCMSLTEATKCQNERQQALENLSRGTIQIGSYVPECTRNGTFAPIQCHNVTRFCWCSTSDGRPIPGSSVRFRKPNCTAVAKSPCFKVLITAMKMLGKVPLGQVHVPRCLPDGTFTSVQCHTRAGYCWCVNETGATIKGTKRSTRLGSPDCSGSKKRRESKECRRSKREDFNEAVLTFIEREMIQSGVTPSSASTGDIFRFEKPSTLTITNRILDWKFKRLDKDHDTRLSRKEVETTIQQWRNFSIPCSSVLLKECDRNKDTDVSWPEWRDCFGYQTSFSSVKKETEIIQKTTPPPGLCKPMRICLLSCPRGFDRDKYGCLICKCRDISGLLSS